MMKMDSQLSNRSIVKYDATWFDAFADDVKKAAPRGQVVTLS